MRSTLFFILLFCLSYCTSDKINPVPEKPANCDPAVNVSYSVNIVPIVDANCNTSGCHASGSGNADLTTHSGLAAVAKTGELEERLLLPLSNPLHMPQGTEMDTCELYELRVWIYEGYQNN